MNIYWNQHKVFLYGMLTLFPKKLENKLMTSDELSRYFLTGSSNDEEASPDHYEQNGYFKLETTLSSGYLKRIQAEADMADRADVMSRLASSYNPPNLGKLRSKVIDQIPLTATDLEYLLKALSGNKAQQYLRFKLVSVNRQKFRRELIAYLTKYNKGELTTDTEIEPELFTNQYAKLRGAAAKDYPQHGYTPVIKPSDIWQSLPRHDTFWELILTSELITQDIKIVNMGYDDRPVTSLAPGISSPARMGTVPFARFTIENDEFKITKSAQPPAPLESAANSSSTLKPAGSPNLITLRSYDANSGTLFFANQEIKIINQKNRLGTAVGEPIQGSAMRRIFKDVNSLKNGVPLRTILSVRSDKFDSKIRKRTTNHLDEINRKIKKETGVPKLINYDQVKYYIDKSYLH
jgi:hypothetical protein